ncbi:MAG: GrpB family protein [Chloroflexi bacterium]|nr:GrpB family protein [Chloroflexota bacterium]MDA1002859.1 GrpB family protein [Chloroflexota bacterium]
MTADVPGHAQPIVVVDYDHSWPQWFARSAAAIREACGASVIAIEHIGSTSVPGLAAKPILDIMPLLARFEDGFDCVGALEARGYESRGEFGIPGRHYFTCPAANGRPPEHVHMYAERADEAIRHRLLRDYLRSHPDRTAAYAALKRELSARYRDDREAYTEAKTDFILETVALARGERAAK